MKLGNYDIVDGKKTFTKIDYIFNKSMLSAPGWVKVSDGPCPSNKIEISDY